MMEIEDIRLLICENYLDNTITETENDYLIAITEAFLKKKEGEEKVDKKEALDKFVGKHVEGLNKRAEFVAKAVVRKPKENEKGVYPKDQYEKYKASMDKWKTLYKIGEMSLYNLVLPKPVDIIINTAIMNKMKSSSNKSDKNVASAMIKIEEAGKSLKEKWMKFIHRTKKEKVSPEESNKVIKTLDLQTAKLAKEMDAVNNKTHAGKPLSTNESVCDCCVKTLLTESFDKNYTTMKYIIESYDFSNPSLNQILDLYMEKLLYDVNL